MPEMIYILGREPELSVAELESIAPAYGAQVTEVTKDFAILQHAGLLTPDVLHRLGGCIKVAEVVDRWVVEGDALSTITAMLGPGWVGERFQGKSRIDFGVSVYGLSREQTARIRRHALAIKKQLKTTGQPVRFVDSKNPQLSAVTVQRQGLLKEGMEFIIAVIGEKIFVGVTKAVQDYQKYSLRDYGRPAADPKSGMVPPKLAQMMLNIAQVGEYDIFLDPFCGSGTIVQEAALLGVHELHGSDSEVKAVKDCQENLRWLAKEFPQLQFKVDIIKADARTLATRANVIVTEPYLGKPLRGHEPVSWLQRQAAELAKLYLETFRHWANTLQKGGRVVMIWPSFVTPELQVTLEIEAEVERLGFQAKDLLSAEASKVLNVADPKVLEYAREYAKIRRQIRQWVLA